MRLKIEDVALVVDRKLRLICKWLASQFHQVKGERRLEIKRTRKCRYYGYCHGSWAEVSIDWDWKDFPYEISDRRFASANCWKEKYSVNNIYELFVAIAGHELAHMQRAPRKMRRSRCEAFCNKRAKELVELFRQEKVMEMAETGADAYYEEIDQKINKEKEVAHWKESPEGKIASLEQRKKIWMSKLKRAQKAIKKLDRKIKYCTRKNKATEIPASTS